MIFALTSGSFYCMKAKHPFSFYLAIITSILALLFFAVIITIWTVEIGNQTEEERLRKALRKVVKERGEAALFSMAGLPISNIFYGDDGLSLFQGESGAWNYSADEQQNIAVYNKVKNSVVKIFSSDDLSESNTGTGVIISSDGYIITNRHVLGSGNEFTVVLSDQTSSDAVLIGSDPITDIAVIKISHDRNGHMFLPISFFLEDELQIGQKALAIGNPYGYEFSLTVGVISGLNRIVSTSSGAVLPNIIQTDASINPGNSGGPLLNGHGEMIGLNTAIYTTTGSSQGISFAIPSKTVLAVATDLIKEGKVSRGWLDAILLEITPQIVEYKDLSINHGIMVSQVVPSGNADKAGLKGGKEKTAYGKSIIYLGGDIIIKFKNSYINTYQDLFTQLFYTKAGDKVDITVLRNDKEVVIKDIVLIEQTIENSRWLIK